MKTLIRNVRVVDETTDKIASVLIENGRIAAILPPDAPIPMPLAGMRVIEPKAGTVLMPAFVELHAHFRDPGFPDKETVESGSLAAVAGGYGTLVCMANTKPVMDSPTAAAALKARSDALGLIDLYPALALTKGMAGTDTSGLDALAAAPTGTAERGAVRVLSEDGKDVPTDAVFIDAFKKAAKLAIPVSCHCDFGGPEAEAAKAAGKGREIVSRIEEDYATERAIKLAAGTGCKLHIAHCSTVKSLDLVRQAKAKGANITCEVSPHHLACTEADAERLGNEGPGRVNPPLRAEEDRQAVVRAILDGTADAIATDHAPHTVADKAGGSPGFVGLETAFAVCRTWLVESGRLDLMRLSHLMSAAPARILGLTDRGRIALGLNADLVLVDPEAQVTVNPATFKSRGKNSPFTGKTLSGKILATIVRGRIVYESGE
ncbi:MAG: dihydroorotase [Treponemataceae bacterium]